MIWSVVIGTTADGYRKTISSAMQEGQTPSAYSCAVRFHDCLSQILWYISIVCQKLLCIFCLAISTIAERWIVIIGADSWIKANTVDNLLKEFCKRARPLLTWFTVYSQFQFPPVYHRSYTRAREFTYFSLLKEFCKRVRPLLLSEVNVIPASPRKPSVPKYFPIFLIFPHHSSFTKTSAIRSQA